MRLPRMDPEHRLDLRAAFLFGLIVLPIYFLSRSFDYRLIFFFGLGAFLVNASRFGQKPIFVLPLLIPRLAATGLLFMVFEQYIPGDIGFLLHVASDVVVQPLMIAFVLWLVFFYSGIGRVTLTARRRASSYKRSRPDPDRRLDRQRPPA